MKMNWQDRIAWWFASFLLSATLCNAVAAACVAYGKDPASLTLSRVAMGIFLYGYVTLLLSIPGCLVAVALILSFKNLQGFRFWVLLIVGSLLGPFSITVFGVYQNLRIPDSGGWGELVRPAELWALAISTLTTLIYLCAARWRGLYPTSDTESEPLH